MDGYNINKFYETGTILEDKKTGKKYKVKSTDLDSVIGETYLSYSVGSIFYYAKLKLLHPWSKTFTPMEWVNWWKNVEKVTNRQFGVDYDLITVTLLPVAYLSHNLTKEEIIQMSYKKKSKMILVDETGEELSFEYVSEKEPDFDFKVLKKVTPVADKIVSILDKEEEFRLKNTKNTMTALYEEYYEPLTWLPYYLLVKQYGPDFVVRTDTKAKWGAIVEPFVNGKTQQNIEFRSSNNTKEVRDYLVYHPLPSKVNPDRLSIKDIFQEFCAKSKL